MLGLVWPFLVSLSPPRPPSKQWTVVIIAASVWQLIGEQFGFLSLSCPYYTSFRWLGHFGYQVSDKWLWETKENSFFCLGPPCQTPFRKPTLLLWISFAIWPEIFASFRSCSEKILLFVRRPGFQVWLGFGQSSSRVSEAPNAQGILGKVASTICRNCLSWLQRGKNQHESLQNIWKSPKKKQRFLCHA